MKKIKMLVSTVLIVSLLATGCSSKGSGSSVNSDTNAKGTNSSPGYGLKDVKFPLEKKVNLNFLLKAHQ
jgi:putative aldouronate transport system substrate-binding protein